MKRAVPRREKGQDSCCTEQASILLWSPLQILLQDESSTKTASIGGCVRSGVSEHKKAPDIGLTLDRVELRSVLLRV